MPRPFKRRMVASDVEVTFFKPAGVPTRNLEVVELGLDELEAIRLADLESMYQAEAAEAMGVSRATFGRLIAAARGKVAKALVQGRGLSIGGGPVEKCAPREYICEQCQTCFEVDCSIDEPQACPECGAAVNCCGWTRRDATSAIKMP